MRQAFLLLFIACTPAPILSTTGEVFGFGAGAFTLELVSTGGATLTQDFQSFTAGALVETTLQFE